MCDAARDAGDETSRAAPRRVESRRVDERSQLKPLRRPAGRPAASLVSSRLLSIALLSTALLCDSYALNLLLLFVHVRALHCTALHFTAMRGKTEWNVLCSVVRVCAGSVAWTSFSRRGTQRALSIKRDARRAVSQFAFRHEPSNVPKCGRDSMLL